MPKIFLKSKKISIDKIVNELYDFSKIGALSLPEILSKEGRQELLKGVKSAKKLFSKVSRKEGKVIQEMETLYIENLKENELKKEFNENINKFIKEYSKIYREIAKKAKFQENSFNSLGFNHYWNNSKGISPHRDYARDKDLISIFILQGKANFYVCVDREKNKPVELYSPPGSLILLRAPRNESEKQYRPFHYVENIENERLSLIVRRSQKD